MSKCSTWSEFLSAEKKKPYFLNILNSIYKKHTSGINIYPKKKISLMLFVLLNSTQ